MRRTLIRLSLTSIVLAGLALGPAACSSSGSKAVSRSEKTVDSLKSFRNEVADAGKQLDRTMASLDSTLTASSNRKKAFDKYMDEMKKLKKQGEDAKVRSDNLRARSKEYVAKWQKEVSQVSNPELQAQANARRARIQDRIDEVQANAAAAKDAYVPLMKNLTDIQTVLANDLSAGGVKSVEPVAAQARKDAAALKKSLDGFVAELDSLISEIGPKATR